MVNLLINQTNKICPNKLQITPQKIIIPSLLGLFGLAKVKIKTQPANDTFEKTNIQEINRQIFIEDFIKGKDKSVDKVLKTHDFTQYGKKGIPLKYSREKFVKELRAIKTNSLEIFNLRKEEDTNGIAKIPPKIHNKQEQQISNIISNYYNNEIEIKDEETKAALNKLVKGMPEFNMTIGKVQHGTHIYSVDIHSLIVLQKSLNNPEYEKLSDESKQVLKLSVLMHDFGKKGKVITPGHAVQSAKDANMVLENYDIHPEIKDRVINIINNHHWFEAFSKNQIDAEGVKKIFNTPEDLQIAKIMAKADLEGISPVFHRQILRHSQFLTQEQFESEFAKDMAKIHY